MGADAQTPNSTPTLDDAQRVRVLAALRDIWGYRELRPLQETAIAAGLSQRDALVVMPTGGGKSLCYQIPPLIADRTDIVISPLIALMKDQVDALRANGYPAVALHSQLTPEELEEAEAQARSGECRLIFVAPERLLTARFLSVLEQIDLGAVAVDEAHCISHWGHDFRKEYRQLAALKQRFPQISIHAFTATATPRVREDIVAQLKLRDPLVLVGTFDRPNLTYRVIPKVDERQQVVDVLQRHRGSAAIVYCITRKRTEQLATWLQVSGFRAACYHAGLSGDERRRTQEAFAREQLDVVVATVAFGMGIDRGDVRCVLHTDMPKSIEHYQQETGRAGRDGLPAECVLLYTPQAHARWHELIVKSAADAGAPQEVIDAARELLGQMQLLCVAPTCRHRQISEYFGQEYPSEKCGACDVCLDELQLGEEATELAQKIISCVARLESRFGRVHVADVLIGSQAALVKKCRHDQLSTFGLLAEFKRGQVVHLIDQLIDQGLLGKSDGDRPLVRLNDASWRVLRGEQSVRLVVPQVRTAIKAVSLDAESLTYDRKLFEHLRRWRRELALERRVPPYVICNDRTLRDVARREPHKREDLLAVHGIGQKKLKELGPALLAALHAYRNGAAAADEA